MRPAQKLKRARRLRSLQTDVERKLWFEVRDRRLQGFKFRRQAPIGPYIVDFVCVEQWLIVELDGGQHAVVDERRRTAFLEGEGWKILRVWNNEVLENLESVIARIAEALANGPHPSPLPRAGEGEAAAR